MTMTGGTKKILTATLISVAVVSLGLFLWARAVFSQENVRTAIEQQLSTALGQPVSIEAVGVGVYPRVTLLLRNVTIGAPVQATAQRLHIGTDLWALLSR